jgi:hypothetical protein
MILNRTNLLLQYYYAGDSLVTNEAGGPLRADDAGFQEGFMGNLVD